MECLNRICECNYFEVIHQDDDEWSRPQNRHGDANDPYLKSESEQFQDHLRSEETCEDHVEDIHDVTEGFCLLIVLGNRQTERETNRSRRTERQKQMFSQTLMYKLYRSWHLHAKCWSVLEQDTEPPTAPDVQ